jgi:hypothetical protein
MVFIFVRGAKVEFAARIDRARYYNKLAFYRTTQLLSRMGRYA